MRVARHTTGDDAGPDDDASAQQPHGLIGRCLVAWTRLCLRHPAVILTAALLSAVASGRRGTSATR